MRRFFTGLLCIALIVSLGIPVCAANAVSRADLSAYISENGSCQITLDLQLNIEYGAESLTFPLPEQARSITVNGNTARTVRGGGVTNVSLGEYAGGGVSIQYTLPNVLTRNQLGGLQVELPLLSGFNGTVDLLLFSVGLPGENQYNPAFYSGYYQQSVEANMQWTAMGSAVSGSVNVQLKDRETLTMQLDVTEALFPQAQSGGLKAGFENTAALILGALALLYWLIFMRCAPILGRRTASAPEGMTAGQLPCGLLGLGADLTMMVFSWAQLGYLLIHTDDHGRVMLHKRMEMGNERSGYEQRAFQMLFGKKRVIDGTGLQYAVLCRKLAAKPDLRELYRKGSGNPRVLRALAALIGVCFGISLGVALVGNALLGIVLVVLLALAGGVSAWLLQEWVLGMQLHYRRKAVYALIILVVWLLLALIGGIFSKALWMAGVQLLAGLLCFYGGRRTELGRQTASQILGLRRYLCNIPREELQRILQYDPDYFFSLAPYALALGVERRFAGRFGGMRLNACPWLTSGLDAHMSAAEWGAYMRQTVDALDRRQKQLPWERLTGK